MRRPAAASARGERVRKHGLETSKDVSPFQAVRTSHFSAGLWRVREPRTKERTPDQLALLLTAGAAPLGQAAPAGLLAAAQRVPAATAPSKLRRLGATARPLFGIGRFLQLAWRVAVCSSNGRSSAPRFHLLRKIRIALHLAATPWPASPRAGHVARSSPTRARPCLDVLAHFGHIRVNRDRCNAHTGVFAHFHDAVATHL